MSLQYAGTVPALRLGALIKSLAPTGGFSHTFGCLDTVQVVQMAAYLTSIYVSGWQSSSTASTTNEPGPDLADYPYTTVPNKVTIHCHRHPFSACSPCASRSFFLLSSSCYTDEPLTLLLHVSVCPA